MGALLPRGLEARAYRETDETRIQRFSRQISCFQKAVGLPGVSVAILRDGRLLWSSGFGWADREARRRADAESVYPVASLTKTFTAALLFDLAREGLLNLDDKMSRYSKEFQSDPARVRHVLSHTSRDVDTLPFSYESGRFKTLTAVAEKAGGKPFQELFWERILDPLDMRDSVPGPDAPEFINEVAGVRDAERASRYREVLAERLARSYRVDRKGRAHPSAEDDLPITLSASSGLLSTVRDLALFDEALDEGRLLPPEMREVLWITPNSIEGPRPYGHGWYVGEIHEVRALWHPGYLPNAGSSLLFKFPDQQLTLIVLANSDGLCAPFAARLLAGDGSASPLTLDFLRLFVEEPRLLMRLPDPNWRKGARRFNRTLAGWARRFPPYSFLEEREARADMERWRESRRRSPSSRETKRGKTVLVKKNMENYNDPH